MKYLVFFEAPCVGTDERVIEAIEQVDESVLWADWNGEDEEE